MGGVFHTDCLAEGPEKLQYFIYIIRLFEISAYSKSHPCGLFQHFKTNAGKCYSGFLKDSDFLKFLISLMVLI